MSHESTTFDASDDELEVFAAIARQTVQPISPAVSIQLARIADELIEARRYVRSCPDHVAATGQTAAFRLRELAAGRLPVD